MNDTMQTTLKTSNAIQDWQLMGLYIISTALFILISLWSLQRNVKPRKGDIQRPSTYAYGSVRKYPNVSYYQMLEELFYVNYYRSVAFMKNSYRWRSHPLIGENIIHDFCRVAS